MNPSDFLVTGSVIVCKNPCSHPGDIRLLTAIHDEARVGKFKHLVNVIVFSSKGDRPEQHKMSGGDLDGDVYMTIWEQRLTSRLSNA